MTRVLVLGASGMLGRAISDTLTNNGFDVIGATSSGSGSSIKFRAGVDSIESVLDTLVAGDFVLNAIGVISHRIDDTQASSRLEAIIANALFPYELGMAAERRKLKVIQIATDCVYAGSSGLYSESSAHDPLDVYGKSKSLGEIPISSVMHIRCSIIGPEVGRNLSLFEWVRNQPKNAELRGYVDHFWNGVTTYAFAKVAVGIISNELFEPGIQHLVPCTTVSKYDLVKLLSSRAGRDDLRLVKWETGHKIDRTLATEYPERNARLWEAAGYANIPSVEALVAEMPIN